MVVVVVLGQSWSMLIQAFSLAATDLGTITMHGSFSNNTYSIAQLIVLDIFWPPQACSSLRYRL